MFAWIGGGFDVGAGVANMCVGGGGGGRGRVVTETHARQWGWSCLEMLTGTR